MKMTLKLEEAAKLILAWWFSIKLGYSWWVFAVWLLSPDISMAGYLINTRFGAVLYNLLHHQAVAVVVGVAGYYFQLTELELAGVVLFGHSAMDRAFGYGLKYQDHFRHTHLGWIGKQES